MTVTMTMLIGACHPFLRLNYTTESALRQTILLRLDGLLTLLETKS